MSQQIVQGGRRLEPGKVIINGRQPSGGFDYGWKKESRFLPTCKPIETATEEASGGDVEIEIL